MIYDLKAFQEDATSCQRGQRLPIFMCVGEISNLCMKYSHLAMKTQGQSKKLKIFELTVALFSERITEKESSEFSD